MAFDIAGYVKDLKQQAIPISIIKLIKEIHINTTMRVNANGELSGNKSVTKGIRQGDSLSPILFNVFMNKIIKEVKHMKGYKMGKSVFNIICYVDDIVFVEENNNAI